MATILSLDNVGAFSFLTMTGKPTRQTHINNASITGHDVLHPSEKSFETVHRVLQNFHILANQGILFTAYPAADAQFFTLVKLNETSGVVLANVCEVYACATTLLSFLWRNISTPLATVFPISRCVVRGWLYAVEPTSNRSSLKWGFLAARNRSNLKDWISISAAFAIIYTSTGLIFMSMTIARRSNNNGFLDTEEGLYTRNACFLKTFDIFLLFNGISSYPRPVNQLNEIH